MLAGLFWVFSPTIIGELVPIEMEGDSVEEENNSDQDS